MSTSTGDSNTSTDGKGIKNAQPSTKLEHLEKFTAAHALPPDVQVDPKAAEMVKYYLQARKDHDFKLVDSIRRNKEFGNPYILTKVVEHFKIEQSGSNFPKEIFDPNQLTAADFEESVKRRRVDTAGSTANSTANSTAAGPPGPVPVPTAASIAASAAAAAGQASSGQTSSAAALAAAVAAITSSMGGTVSATAAVAAESGREGGGEPRRRSKWG